MHIIIAFITAAASLLYALERFGIDIGWINPWAWNRKRKWLKQYRAHPALSLKNPLEATALLLTATAKIDGDLSIEEKSELKRIFEESFHQSPKDASALLVSSTFLIGDGHHVFQKPQAVLEPCLASFTDTQKTSALELLATIASVGSPPSETQQDFIAKIQDYLFPNTHKNKKDWQ